MMKNTLAFFTLLLGCVAMFAQSGPTFPYQAVVRNSQNQLIKESTFNIDVKVYQGTELKYSETQRVTTNANGQFTMNIGGGAVVSGALTDVADWSVAKFKITYHLSEGDIVSEDFVHPVPYALQAANNAALTELLNTMNARMDSLDHLVDSLSNLNHGGGTTAFTCGTSKVKDVENNEYSTVRIGNQCWMKENLRTDVVGGVYPKKNDGQDDLTPDEQVVYGRLYTWAAVMQNESGDKVQGICPDGWHVPSKAEWDTLTTYVSSVEAYKCNSSIASALSDSTGWKSSSICCAGDNSSATINITGFAAVPAGSFTDGFGGFGYDAYFWSATEYNNQMALCQSLHSLATGVSSYEDYKSHCYSVRCVRNADAGGGTPATPATMSCEDVMECLGDTLDRLNARITSQGTEIQNLEGTVTTQGQTIETLEGTVTTQSETIDSLNHIVDSLSDLSHGSFTCGISKVTDIDGNEYHTVQIGTQCWMKENLRTTKTPTGNDITSGMWNAGTNPVETLSENSVEIYGRLYDWTTVMNGLSSSDDTPNGVQGICPDGWHVPSDTEWKQMEMAVGMSQTEADATGPRGDIAAKLSGNTGWYSSSTTNAAGNPNAPDRNSSGFSALPAGLYINSSCTLIGSDAVFWSATEFAAGIGAYTHSLSYSSAFVGRGISGKAFCYSVRCVRDTETGGGSHSAPDGGDNDCCSELSARLDSLENVIDSLANVINNGGGTPAEVADGQPCPGAPTVSDGTNTYNTVKIGNQCWMKENLRTTTKRNNVGTIYTNNTAEGYNAETYGYYYDWAAVMQNESGDKVQGICPDGWHVPSDAEWDTLTHYVFNSTSPDYKCGEDCGSWSAQSNVSCIAKALSSTTGWSNTGSGCNAGNTGDKANATGFSAVPAGYCFYGDSNDFGNYAYFWSATQYDGYSAWSRYLRGYASFVDRDYGHKDGGYSVRCLRD